MNYIIWCVCMHMYTCVYMCGCVPGGMTGPVMNGSKTLRQGFGWGFELKVAFGIAKYALKKDIGSWSCQITLGGNHKDPPQREMGYGWPRENVSTYMNWNMVSHLTSTWSHVTCQSSFVSTPPFSLCFVVGRRLTSTCNMSNFCLNLSLNHGLNWFHSNPLSLPQFIQIWFSQI